MRILLVVHGLPPERVGGTETYTHFLAHELIRQGHEVRVFLPVRDSEAEEFTWRDREVNGLRRWEVVHEHRAANAFEDHFRQPALEPALEACLAAFQPEVVHFTYLLGGLSATLPARAKAAGVHVIVTLTDFNPICAWGQLMRRDGSLCAGPDMGLPCVDCFFGANAYAGVGALKRLAVSRHWLWPPEEHLDSPELRRIQNRLLTNHAALSSADRLIFPTEALQAKYESALFDFEPVNRLDFGIDLQLFDGFTRKPSGGPLRLGFIGQLLPHKGLHVLLDALESMPDLELQVYGDPQQPGAEAYVRDRCAGLRQSWVRFNGTFPMEQMAEVYSGFDALVIPSLWPENSPLVLPYALVTGTPVLASDFGGLSPLIEPGVTGILVAPGDKANWRRAVEHFRRKQSAFFPAGRVEVERQRHGIEGHVEKLMRHYRLEPVPRDNVGLD